MLILFVIHIILTRKILEISFSLQAIVLAAIVAFAAGAAITPSKEAVILKYDAENIGIDGYKFK